MNKALYYVRMTVSKQGIHPGKSTLFPQLRLLFQ